MTPHPQATPTASSTKRGTWRALMPESLKNQALEVLHEIAHGLPAPEDCREGSVCSGLAGHSLFHAFYALSGVDGHAEAHRSHAMNHLERAVDQLAQNNDYPAFFGGYPGIAWAVELHQSLGFLDADEDFNEEMDEQLLAFLESTPASDHLPELIGGLAGLGTYAVERLPRHPGAKRVLTKILDCLEVTAEHKNGGVTWFNQPEALGPMARQMHPSGCYNLGLSHGVPGLIAFLSEAQVLGEDRAASLLEGTVTWVLSTKRDFTNGSHFTYSVDALTPERSLGLNQGSRVAWCYGDLGIAAALLIAARKIGRDDWAQEALTVARDVAARGVNDVGCLDAGLCHGAFGNAHIFNRLYQASGDPALLQGFHDWMQCGFNMRRPGEGIGGYLTFMPHLEGQEERSPWIVEPGLLEGAAGIGLALIAALSDVEPTWDRFLLVNVPPMEA